MAHSNGTEQQPAPRPLQPEPVVVERGTSISVEWHTPDPQPEN
ncbi:hypothetical protein ACFZDG_18415 [Kitasatospora xanthocidica]